MFPPLTIIHAPLAPVSLVQAAAAAAAAVGETQDLNIEFLVEEVGVHKHLNTVSNHSVHRVT